MRKPRERTYRGIFLSKDGQVGLDFYADNLGFARAHADQLANDGNMHPQVGVLSVVRVMPIDDDEFRTGDAGSWFPIDPDMTPANTPPTPAVPERVHSMRIITPDVERPPLPTRVRGQCFLCERDSALVLDGTQIHPAYECLACHGLNNPKRVLAGKDVNGFVCADFGPLSEPSTDVSNG